MSTDLINAASYASDEIDIQLAEASRLLRSIPTKRTSMNVLVYPDLIPGQIDQVIRALIRAREIVLATDWRKARESEV